MTRRITRMKDSESAYGVFRIVVGCLAGHIPWYVLFWL